MKRKIKLGDLKVKSFITMLNEQQKNYVKGEGLETRLCAWSLDLRCSTHPPTGQC